VENLLDFAVVFVAPFLLFGMFGNYLYYTHAKRKIAAIKMEVLDEEMRKMEITKSGGINWWLPILLIYLPGFILALIMFLSM
jgi:hypothetical protein